MWMKVTVCIFLPDTHKADPPTHKYTQCLRYRKSKYELVEAATEAKSTPPPHICWKGLRCEQATVLSVPAGSSCSRSVRQYNTELKRPLGQEVKRLRNTKRNPVGFFFLSNNNSKKNKNPFIYETSASPAHLAHPCEVAIILILLHCWVRPQSAGGQENILRYYINSPINCDQLQVKWSEQIKEWKLAASGR